MTENAWPAAIRRTLDFEGGYVDDPDDPGGETNFGISKRSYPNENIADMTEDRAAAIYHRDFWLALRCPEMPDAVGSKLFDLAVNMGPRNAVKLLQRAVNHTGYRPPLAIDGGIGPATMAAITVLDGARVLAMYRSEARNHYIELATEHPKLRRFLNGWLRRAAA